MVAAQSTHASFAIPTTSPQWVPRSPRRATRLHAVVDNHAAKGGASRAAGRVRDVSQSGAFVEADAQLTVGARVAVLSLAGETGKARRPAEVARVVESGVGLRFLDAKEDIPADAPVFLFLDDDAEQADANQALRDENTRLQKRVTTLEELLRRAMLTGW